MYEPIARVSPTPVKAPSLIRAEALEVEITELCAFMPSGAYQCGQLPIVATRRRTRRRSSLGCLGTRLLRTLAQLALRHRHERGAGKSPRRACAQTVTADLCIVCHG